MSLILVTCSKERAPTPVGAISGRVPLVGYLIANDSHVVGTRAVDDADSVGVELLRSAQLLRSARLVATAATSDGAYREDCSEVCPQGAFCNRTPGAFTEPCYKLQLAKSEIVIWASVGGKVNRED